MASDAAVNQLSCGVVPLSATPPQPPASTLRCRCPCCTRPPPPQFLRRKWEREHDYALRKYLWAHNGGSRISVCFEYEYRDAQQGQWFRAYGNENWEFDQQVRGGRASWMRCLVSTWHGGTVVGWVVPRLLHVFGCPELCLPALPAVPAVPAVLQGLMRKRVASINEAPIAEGERRIAVPNPSYNTWLADQVGA